MDSDGDGVIDQAGSIGGLTSSGGNIHIENADNSHTPRTLVITTPDIGGSGAAEFGMDAHNGAGRLVSDGGVSVFIDSDDDETNRNFEVVANQPHYNANTKRLFTVEESGKVNVHEELCIKGDCRDSWSGGGGGGGIVTSTQLSAHSGNDAILNLRTSDNSWLYSQWLDRDDVRKAWMGLDAGLDTFNIYLENGADTIALMGGNVGIGTDSPDATLDIESPHDGSSAFRITSGGPSGYYHFDIKPRAPASSQVDWDFFQTNMDTEKHVMTIAHTGNVGIGTDAPEKKLHVEDESDPTIRVKGPDGVPGSVQVQDGGRVFEMKGGSGVSFTQVDVGPRMTIDWDGKVNVHEQLCIKGDCRDSWGGAGGDSIHMNIGDGNTDQKFINWMTVDANGDSGFQDGDKGWHFTTRGHNYGGAGHGENDDLILFSHGGPISSWTPVMTFDHPTGNVGIGTKLNVGGDVDIGGSIKSGGVTKGFYVSSSVSDKSDWGGHWYGLSLGDPAQLDIADDAQANKWAPVLLQGYYGLAMRTAHGSLVLRRDGEVGIGTTNPDGRLHVTGIGWTDQTASPDTSSFPIQGPGYGFVLDGGYTNGQYRTRMVKIDRVNNLPLYIQESLSTADSYSNIARFGTHVGSTNVFEVFGNTAIGGDTRIGSVSPKNTGTFPEYGKRLYLSGGPAGASWDSDNSDSLWLARFNKDFDKTELRIGIGDNDGQVEDKFVVGLNDHQDGSKWKPKFTVQMDGKIDALGHANIGPYVNYGEDTYSSWGGVSLGNTDTCNEDTGAEYGCPPSEQKDCVDIRNNNEKRSVSCLIERGGLKVRPGGNVIVKGDFKVEGTHEKPWFLAGGTKSQGWVGAPAKTWRYIKLNDVKGPSASNYNTGNGRWTAPETGLYYCFAKPYKSYQSGGGYHHTISTCWGPTHASNICNGFNRHDYTLGSSGQGGAGYADSTGAISGLYYLEEGDQIAFRVYTRNRNAYMYFPRYTRLGCVKQS